jgi:hypothetical protein
MENFVSYLLRASYHNYYINRGICLFAHFTPFINMTMDMYIILFQGGKSDVHMMCLIPMLNLPCSKLKNLLVLYYYLPQIVFEKLVEIVGSCIDGCWFA